MTPFRVLDTSGDGADLPPRGSPPELLAFATGDSGYRIVTRSHGVVTVQRLDRHDGIVHERTQIETLGGAVGALASPNAWSVYELNGTALQLHRGHDDSGHVLATREIASGSRALGFNVDGQPAIAIAITHGQHDSSRGPDVLAYGADLQTPLATDWFAPATARALVAATATVFGPAVVFATDHDDEVDVCAYGRGGERMQRTVSLGRGQSLACVAGGGSRIVVVSRDALSVVVRTLASDVRSELNPAPIRARTGWEIGRVLCAYANGPFVVAHEERRDDARAVVVTTFDAGDVTSVRLALPRVDGLAVEGKDLAVIALLGGASGTLAVIQRLMVTGGRHRRYAYLLDAPRSDTREQRRALLLDMADLLSISLGAAAPRRFATHSQGDHEDVATFQLPGPDAAHDLSVALLARQNGSGIASVRIGAGAAPEARGLNFAGRIRELITGDDDGDPNTTRVEIAKLGYGIESVVSALGALRSVRSAK